MAISAGEALNVESRYGLLMVRYATARSDVAHSQQEKDAAALLVSKSSSPARPTLVRVQSSCIFGESFHSIECDCAPQLEMALERVEKENGLLVYCFEEGRGAGLARKIQAMSLQKREGLDTEEAYRKLGLGVDIRNYIFAGECIKAILGPNPEIRLMTNSPDKIMHIRNQGITIVGLESALPGNVDPHAIQELAVKREKFGHIIPKETR